MAGELAVTFRPFGDRFEVRSNLPLAEVKAAIRARKTGWFDPKTGARGWICGSFICLWLSAFDQHGPMVFGRIKRNNFGTLVTGRAGSDLNGIVMLVALMPLMTFLAYKGLEQGLKATGGLTMVAAFFAVGIPLAFWMAHKDRSEAQVLVRFLHNALASNASTTRKAYSQECYPKKLKLNVNDAMQKSAASPATVAEALYGLGSDEFVILSATEQHFIQTLSLGECFKIEMFDGDQTWHFRAVRRGLHAAGTEAGDDLFSADETLEIFDAYGKGVAYPDGVTWQAERS